MLSIRNSVTSFLRRLYPFSHQRSESTATGNPINPPLNKNVDYGEIVHHGKIADDWWDPTGPLKGLHSLNEIRVPFIRDGLIATKKINQNNIETTKILEGINILEVGCGGGILTEQLARLHAKVTGIDLGSEVIAAAKQHLENDTSDICERVTYKVEPIEEHIKEYSESYDAIVLSEVIEHVTEKEIFLKDCIAAVKPGGSIFITTINKTIPLWVGGILLGENVFNIIPKGTHHWNKLITPVELRRMLDHLNCSTILVNGSIYEFWRNSWSWTSRTDFCYALQAIKN